VRHVAVPVGRALPDAHGGEMRRLQRGDVPLVDAVVRDAVEPDLAVRPRLNTGPFDAVVEVLRLPRREMIDITGRAAGAARIHAHARIAVRHPFLRVDHLPALIEVRGSRRDVGMLFHHALPRARVTILEREAFGVRPVGENDGMPVLLDRPEHVGAQHEAVVHGDRHIPVDAHAVAGFTALGHAVSLPALRCAPLPPRAKRVVGRGWGAFASLCNPPPLTPPRRRQAFTPVFDGLMGRGEQTARVAYVSLTS
jgi:hypothetical protein